MFIRLAVVVATLTAVASPVRAQLAEPPAPNVVYGELFGNALLVSVNYERFFRRQLAGRIGLTYIEGSDDEGARTDQIFGVPLMVNYISRPESNHHFEAGGGFLLLTGESTDWAGFDSEDFSTLSATATIGYRYQRPGGGFVFRSGFTPLFSTDGILPWFGISFGGNF